MEVCGIPFAFVVLGVVLLTITQRLHASKVTMSDTFTLYAIPATLAWKISPLTAPAMPGRSSTSRPALTGSSPILRRAGLPVRPLRCSRRPTRPSPSRRRSRLSCSTTYDRGRCSCTAHDALWAKLCFEYSPQGQPMVVSVVTRGVSDDCNSVDIAGNSVYLRVYRHGKVWPSTIRVTATTGTSCATSPGRRGGDPAGRLLHF